MTAASTASPCSGLGLIGGSLLHAMRHSGLEVVGYDIDPATAAAASAAGFPVAPTDAAAVHGADLVVLAMPLPQVPAALRSLAPHLAAGHDAHRRRHAEGAGARRGARARPAGPLRRRPPARRHRGERLGRHRSAAVPRRAVDADLEPDTDLEAWLRVAELVCDLGAKPVPTTAAEQDAAVARVIGLPHVLAEALALIGLAGGPLGLSLAAGLLHVRLAGRPHPARARRHLVRRQPRARRRARRGDRAAERRPRRAGRATARCSTLAAAGHRARMNWEHRAFEPVELPVDADALLRARARRRLDHRGAARRRRGPAARHAAARA